MTNEDKVAAGSESHDSEADDLERGRDQDVEIREISECDLRQVIAEHYNWLASEGRAGRRADLSRTSLEGRDLSGVNLEWADLTESNLQKTNLSRSDLRWSSLTGADLRESSLENTDLRCVDLCDCDLSLATGLKAYQLGGADTEEAKLPDQVAKSGDLQDDPQLPRWITVYFFGIVLACAYVLARIFTTTDAELVLNNSQAALPLIDAPVPIVFFYSIVPAILLAAYLFVHLSLWNIWERLAKLPAVFPDGKRLDEIAQQWFVSAWAYMQIPRLWPWPMWPPLRWPTPPWFVVAQAWISAAVWWWAVPVTLYFAWARCVPRHALVLTMTQAVILTISVSVWMLSNRGARQTLQGRRSWQPQTGSRPQFTIPILLSTAVMLICFALSLGATNGVEIPVIRYFAPFGLHASLEGDDLSSRSELDRSDTSGVKGADLRGANLRRMKADGVFLAKADLVRADLSGASLRGADLRGANLDSAIVIGADLQGAFLSGAHLHDAQLWDTNLASADLEAVGANGAIMAYDSLRSAVMRRDSLGSVNLRSAYLVYADLQEAFLFAADLRDANMRGANLHGAKLWAADLRSADLGGVRGWEAIQEIGAANLLGVKDPPPGFIDWAVQREAFCSDSTVPILRSGGYFGAEPTHFGLKQVDGAWLEQHVRELLDLPSAEAREEYCRVERRSTR